MDSEVPVDALVAVHITQRVNLHHQGYKGDQTQHSDGHRVNEEAQRQGHASFQARQSGVEPDPLVVAGQGLGSYGCVALFRSRGSIQPSEKRNPEENKPGRNGGNGQQRPLAGQPVADDHDDRRGSEAEYRNEPGPLHQQDTNSPLPLRGRARVGVNRSNEILTRIFTISSS